MDKITQWKTHFDKMIDERGMQQHWDHFRPFMELLDSLDQKRIMVEIGPYLGGATGMFGLLFDQVITVDPYHYEGFEADIKRASDTDEAVETLMELLQGQKIDALFIDGDHSFRGARQDMIRYAPFVCEGGIVGFHDVGHRGINPWTLMKEGSDELLAEIKHQPPKVTEGYSYYGDPLLDETYEYFDFEGLAAIRWCERYADRFADSLYIYPLDMVIHREWVDRQTFERIQRMSAELSIQVAAVGKEIQKLVPRLEVKK